MVFSHFEYILDVVIVFNDKREIIYFNSATATLLDMSPRRIKKVTHVYDLITFGDKEIFLMEDGEDGKEEELKLKEIPFVTKKDKAGVGLVSIKKMLTEGSSTSLEKDQKVWITVIRDISLEVSLHSKYQEKLREMEVANKKLEEYSHDLEEMVEKRTLELKKAHDFQKAMVNSLDQGLVVFDTQNNCHPSFTNACLRLFPSSPEGAKVYDVLGLNEKEVEDFKKWSSCIFSNVLPFEDAARLGQQFVEMSENEYRYISLEYFPMLGDDGELYSIVMVGTDKTEEVKAKKLLEEKNSYVSMVTRVLSNKKQFLVFYRDFMECSSYLNEIDFNRPEKLEKEKVKISLHSMKGSCGVYGMSVLANVIHSAEDLFEQYLEGGDEDVLDQFSIKLDEVEKVSKFNFNEAAKFVNGNSLNEEDERVDIKVTELLEFRDKLIKYGAIKISKYFSDEFLKTKIGDFFSGYNEMVTELADKLDKKIAPLEFSNPNIKISAKGYDELFNALPHLFRNCVYHGIEDPETRKSKEKEAFGHIKVKFGLLKEGDDDFLEIAVGDDGAGIDVEKIRLKLIGSGVSEAKSMDREDLVKQIFSQEVSTAEGVNDMAGRGVGMHAVKLAVEKLNGRIDIKTEEDKGTEFIVKLPLAG